MQAMLDGQTALVTGASRGIGKAIALALSGAGASVAGTATTDDGAAAIATYLKDAGHRGEGGVDRIHQIAGAGAG